MDINEEPGLHTANDGTEPEEESCCKQLLTGPENGRKGGYVLVQLYDMGVGMRTEPVRALQLTWA